MAEDQDDAQKTEEPSQRKLEESAKKGDVPVSQELKHLVMLAGSALAFVVAAGPLVEAVRGEAAGFIAHAHAIPVNPGNILAAMRDSGAQILLAMMLPFGILLLAGLAGNLLQMKPMFTTEKINTAAPAAFGNQSPATPGMSSSAGRERKAPASSERTRKARVEWDSPVRRA